MKKLRKIGAVLLAAVLLVSAVLMSSCGAANGAKIDEKHFPDTNFRKYVFENFDANGDWTLSKEELSIANSINVFNMGISSLKGLEYFTKLESLTCDSCPLDELDLSKNTELTYLDCDICDLDNLDLSHNKKIKVIWCTENNFTKLDVSNCTELEKLACWSNEKLTEINLTGCKGLKELSCDNCNLSQIDVSDCPELTKLWCTDNNLTELDISNNPLIDLSTITGLMCDDSVNIIK